MKRTHCYEVNHLMKTVVVTRRFLEEASQMGTPAADLMEQFIEKGFTVTVYHKAPRKAAKPENGKLPLLTYRMMEAYIAMLDDAEDMLDVFKSVKEAAKSRSDRVRFVNAWFRNEFPNYDAIPEFDANYRVVHNPNVAA